MPESAPATRAGRTEARATCQGCGCGCDDIEVAVAAGRIEHLGRTCPLGDVWFAEHADVRSPLARVDGQEVELGVALDQAADILAGARLPLVYGLGQTSLEAQREAVAIAEAIGGVIDPASALLDEASGLAFQTIGQSSTTFGEVRDRAELVVAWRADPVATHPRLLPRLRFDAMSRWTGGDKPARRLEVVDAQRTATAREADTFMQLSPELDVEALWTLRAFVRGVPLEPELTAGLPLDALEELAKRLKACRHAAIVYGPGPGTAGAGSVRSFALHALVRDLSRVAHVVALTLRRQGNAIGAEDVLAWQTGYPTAVSFARGYPRANPEEFTAAALLARGDADAALVVGSDPLEDLPERAAETLRAIPSVVVDSRDTATAAAARVALICSTAGVHRAGTAHRMDGIPVPLRAPLPAARPGDEEILAALGARLAERRERRRGDRVFQRREG
jgi:formylmethanofuran dehydrogenase subunit B